MIDFDKLFEDYLVSWYAEHESAFNSVDEMEELVPQIYEEWAASPCPQIGGIAPRAFFDNIASPAELIDILIGTSTGDQNPCSLLMDRIAAVPECAAGLYAVIDGEYSPKQKLIAINLLRETDAPAPLETFVKWLPLAGIDGGLKELAVEILAENADAVSGLLFPLLEGADEALKADLAEILVNAKKDDRTFALLTDLFASGYNPPLCAGYLGKYGDERCAPLLYKALDDCGYLEYIEIKNAIERLGGVVDDTRDFSSDEYYAAIKNLR
ncbi:MAG: hypothetical protein LBP26_05230 [Clostridiales bacterium]|jgi:hypothetical protein|nr:hypothetical protein [Clostridiales bacterium]